MNTKIKVITGLTILGSVLLLRAADSAPACGGGQCQGAGMGQGFCGGANGQACQLMAKLDANGDKALADAEIAQAGNALLALDANKDGKLTRDEFCKNAANCAKAQDGQPAACQPRSKLVQALDANKDGIIDGFEIGNAHAAIFALDANKDGKVTCNEIRPENKGQGMGNGNGKGKGWRGGRGQKAE